MPPGKSKIRVSKTAFVLGLPKSMSAKEVVAEGKKKGCEISEKYVYVVRSNAKRKARSVSVGGRKTRRVVGSTLAASRVAQFRKLAFELGLDRAEQVLSDTRKKVQQIISGS